MTDQTALVTVESFEKKYPRDKFNLLVPSIQIINNVQKFQKIAVEVVNVAADPKDGDVFKVGKKDGKEQFSLMKTPLRRISNAVGISWIPNECHRVDDRSDRDYFEYAVAGWITKPDGSKMKISGVKAIDVQTYVSERRMKLQHDFEDKKLKKWSNSPVIKDSEEARIYIERECQKTEIERRKHGLALAESGAKNRAIRDIGNLKGAYTAEELAKPFIILRVDRDVEEIGNDLDASKEVRQTADEAADELYDNPKPAGDGPHIQDADYEMSETDKRNEYETVAISSTTDERYKMMLNLIETKNMRSESDPTQPFAVSFKNWEAREPDNQVKVLMWAYDKPIPPKDDEIPV